MKKVLYIIYAALFLIPCVFFSAGMLLPGSENTVEDVEMPALIVNTPSIGINSKFGTEFEEYFSKSFAYRNKVVDVFSKFKANIFGEGNDQVIIGKDGFLFFADTMDSYKGTDPMSDDEINACADALLSMYEYAAEKGAKFLFACAPNKNSIYGEMLPDRYIKGGGDNDISRLHEALDKRGVPYVDLTHELTSAKGEALLYHKRDTHWNNDGALVALDAMARTLGFTTPDFSEFSPAFVHDHEGDLDKLLFPDSKMYDDNTAYDLSEQYIYTTAYKTPMDLRIATRGAGEGKLLMFRDSFANALIPFMASSFSEAKFERATPYFENIALLDSFDADYVIVEIAERNLRNLAPKEAQNQ